MTGKFCEDQITWRCTGSEFDVEVSKKMFEIGEWIRNRSNQ